MGCGDTTMQISLPLKAMFVGPPQFDPSHLVSVTETIFCRVFTFANLEGRRYNKEPAEKAWVGFFP